MSLDFHSMLKTLKVNRDRMFQGARGGFTNATDGRLPGEKGALPEAEIVGRLVLQCIQEDRLLEELTLEEYRQISPFSP